MRSWTGIALARTAPGGDGMQSRLSTYLHPLAGRPLAWHTLSALAAAAPAAERLVLLTTPELSPEPFDEIAPAVEVLAAAAAEPAPLPELETDAVLLVDAAAPAIGPLLPGLLQQPPGAGLRAPDGSVAAAWLTAADARAVLDDGGSLAALEARLDLRTDGPRDEAVVVRDRAALARAARLVRDRIVERLMAAGVTFLLPETVLVDVEVRIGRDSVIYPGVVLEGATSVGEETVIGPGCRIIDSWIGSGVELKGWNFVTRSSIRNRAILEPYVRRGFD
jgi:bifunctional N-acetylglucosamine-1-phosphate-uridyltransferase/glucosamine-1-phosphate-acetyltransferase GlmU-like protein